MRIGIYDPYLDILGGGEKYMLTAASCLSDAHEVNVFWNSKDILQDAQKKFDIDLSKVTLNPNIFDPNISFIKRFFKSRQYDAIFFLSDGSLPIISSNLYVHFQFPVEWVNTKSLLENIKLKRIRKVICNSNFTKNHIDRKFNVESSVVYPPTYYKSDFPKVDYEAKINIILNVGRYGVMPDGSSFKKQEFIIDSFKKLYDSGLKDWELHLVLSFQKNDTNFIEKMKKSIKDYPIKFFENISYKEILREYSQAKIYWHASGFGEDLETHPEKAEHFGITTVEAMLNGVVPVVIDAGGQKEIINQDESGFLWETQEELLLKTLMLAKDNEKWTEMSLKAAKASKIFSTDNFCQNINKIFTK